MRRSYLYGLLVFVALAVALAGVLADDEPAGAPVAVAVEHFAIGPEAAADPSTTNSSIISTTSTPLDDREPDVDANGDPVEDHLGASTTSEPELQSAAQPTGTEPPPETTQPPPETTQPPATAAASTTTQPPPPSTTSNPGGPNGDMESQFASLVNSYRSGNGLGGLTRDGSLDSYARSWSERLAANGGLSHSDIGSLLGSWSSVAENVGMGGSVDAVFNALAGSSGHRANMLGGYTHFGIGVWVDSSGTVWTTHVFAG